MKIFIQTFFLAAAALSSTQVFATAMECSFRCYGDDGSHLIITDCDRQIDCYDRAREQCDGYSLLFEGCDGGESISKERLYNSFETSDSYHGVAR